MVQLDSAILQVERTNLLPSLVLFIYLPLGYGNVSCNCIVMRSFSNWGVQRGKAPLVGSGGIPQP
jgi:hypothetical protein